MVMVGCRGKCLSLCLECVILLYFINLLRGKKCFFFVEIFYIYFVFLGFWFLWWDRIICIGVYYKIL